ncbi:MAG: molybdenum ABC transporter ATP-binding protein [Alphaproteobacteria bacterium CG_4_10_14_0_2_um_filter_63_37]|nr:MAG: molybdenum ABC transporter ATP-binding protein [Proteobacteria bacterium CG1_02_64_396]PJA25185.1 MAG: molybdenum ABC transporter ATP-binding protein [Alphaproteobacteria bacterium CG_4_10_14_0_2_um_filter_63_37]
MSIQGAFALDRGSFSLQVDFDLPLHGVTALFGHSGSGKTTWLRCIAGLERGRGSLRVGDQCWQDDATGCFVPVHRRPIGYVFQEASLFPHLSVRENLLYGWRRIVPDQRRVALDEVVEWLGLAPLIDRSPEGLSGGERQRVAIGRALLTSPRVLLMDEPLAALDARAKGEILPYLEGLHRRLQIPVLYVSHAVEEVARLADRVIRLDGGRVVDQGGIAQVLTRMGRTLTPNGEEEGAVIEARVTAHDEAQGLTRLQFCGGELLAPLLEVEEGARVRLWISAREVSLALSPHTDTSVLNILAATIEGSETAGPGRMLVRLRCDAVQGGTTLLARITRLSWDKLGLASGQQVFAQIKGVGLAR